MERSGSILECALLANHAISADQKLYESREAQISKKAHQDLYEFLQKTHKENDVLLLLENEKLLLNLDLQNRANSPEEVSSIANAVSQIEAAMNAYGLVLDVQLYSALSKSYAEKQKKNGLPQDAVCVFIQSHTARLNNKLAAPLPVPMKNVLRQRKENMSKIKKLYIELQCTALDIPYK